MFIVGFDLGKRKSQLCVQNEDGKVLAELRIDTTPDAIAKALEPFPGAHVLVEASTSAERVAGAMEEIGCTVVVADPRFSLMYAQRDKKVKNDRRDARALADALRLKAYRKAHRPSKRARALRAKLLVRQDLVHSRTEKINLVRAICERAGIIIPKAESDAFVNAIETVPMIDWIFDAVAPSVTLIEQLTEKIDECDRDLAAIAAADPVAQLLRTTPGVGPLTALAFIAAIDDPHRFENARQVSAYLGLVPSEDNSGDSKRPPGAITKTGDTLLRSYLVSAAFSSTKKTSPDSHLKRWRNRIAGEAPNGEAGKIKKTKKLLAAVAVARKLSRILWAMWRDNKPFDASRTAPGTVKLKRQETPKLSVTASL